MKAKQLYWRNQIILIHANSGIHQTNMRNMKQFRPCERPKSMWHDEMSKTARKYASMSGRKWQWIEGMATNSESNKNYYAPKTPME